MARRRLLVVASALGVLLGFTGGPPAFAGSGAAPPSLQASFDNVGITAAGATATGDFDGIGDSFDAASLAADALVPGQPLLHDSQALEWPDVAPGAPDNVLADGQTVAVRGAGNVLGVVGASAYGTTSGTLTVHYADGAPSAVTLTLADWVDQSPASGSDLLAATEGWNPGGTIPVHLWYVAIPLVPGEPVASVTLPLVGGAVGAGVPSMHVFDLQVGTVGANAAGAPGAPSTYDLSRKDCLGTAADTASKVWYTVAGGSPASTARPSTTPTSTRSTTS